MAVPASATSTKSAASITQVICGASVVRLAKRRTENAEAYQLYLKGRYLWVIKTQSRMPVAATYAQSVSQGEMPTAGEVAI